MLSEFSRSQTLQASNHSNQHSQVTGQAYLVLLACSQALVLLEAGQPALEHTSNQCVVTHKRTGHNVARHNHVDNRVCVKAQPRQQAVGGAAVAVGWGSVGLAVLAGQGAALAGTG